MGGETGARRAPARQILWLAPGFCLWFSALVVVYVLHSVGCAFGWSAGTLRLSLAAALIIHIAAIAGLWRVQALRGPNPSFGRTGVFLHWIIIGTLVSALAKIVLTLGPTLFLSACT
ncbi:hypothetical protein [Ancylobacter amanitiformis]|uniref:Uncharacterized protein n=1 Tax=Ancylobacter amanitiformis TaxID=217069 RepID=A0ABU0LSY6_9HYPH|nr:hypothetical protein [Ancylobacter amanitiformis]MDQ0511755.1 hypothetical protein [Ancylobacter amanitiformis]